VALLGAIIGDLNIRETIEVQDIQRYIDAPENNIDNPMLFDFMAVTPEEVQLVCIFFLLFEYYEAKL